VDFGMMNTVIAFAIASVKAVLVLAFFMHLKYDNMLNRVIIGTAVFFLIVLWLFSTVDIASRVLENSPL
jgi:cytochrome c oxidase subunit 4